MRSLQGNDIVKRSVDIYELYNVSVTVVKKLSPILRCYDFLAFYQLPQHSSTLDKRYEIFPALPYDLFDPGVASLFHDL